jgi:hypothetical protein
MRTTSTNDLCKRKRNAQNEWAHEGVVVPRFAVGSIGNRPATVVVVVVVVVVVMLLLLSLSLVALILPPHTKFQSKKNAAHIEMQVIHQPFPCHSLTLSPTSRNHGEIFSFFFFFLSFFLGLSCLFFSFLAYCTLY